MDQHQEIKIANSKSHEEKSPAITDPNEIRKIWDNEFTPENLKYLFNTKVKTSRFGAPKQAIGLDYVSIERFEEQLDENIEIIIRKIRNQTYQFTRYKLILVNKGPGKAPRELRIPTVRDRITLAAMANFAKKVLGGRCEIPKGKNIIREIIKERDNYSGYVKSDISKFFRTIPHDQLSELMNRKFIYQDIIDVFKNSVTTGALTVPSGATYNPKVKNTAGIPEGLAYSSFLANAYLESIDDKYSNIPEIRYYRFVDDILILADSSRTDFYKNEITDDFKKLGLEISQEKTKNNDDSLDFDYLGYSFSGNLITIRDRSVAKIQDTMADFLKKIAKQINSEIDREELSGKGLIAFANRIRLEQFNHAINNKITGFKIGDVYYTWLNYYSLINDLSLLARLDSMVENLLKRYGIDDLIKPKKFMKAFYEARHNPNSDYIPDYTTIVKAYTNAEGSCFSQRKIKLSKSKTEKSDIVKFEIKNDMLRKLAISAGWNSNSDQKMETVAESALAFAFLEGFKLDVHEGEVTVNLQEFRRKFISGLKGSINAMKSI